MSPRRPTSARRISSLVVPLGLTVLVLAVLAATGVGLTARAAAHDDHETSTSTSATTSATTGGGETPVGVSSDSDLGGIRAETSPAPVAGDCPVMTDSIRRLYLAALDREPTTQELQSDTERYRTGQANLEDLADGLAASGLFRTANGPLSDEAYVRLLAGATRTDPIDDSELTFWTTNLAAGYARGRVLLAFSETPAFGADTGTSPPLSGYLQWYPRGVHWYCGTGPRVAMPIAPLVGSDLYADYMFTNWGGSQSTIGLSTRLADQPHMMMNDGSLPAGYTSYRWDGRFINERGRYGDALDVRADADTSWVVVFYPSPLGRQRIGWQIPR